MYDSIKVRTKEGMAITVDILLGYTYTTSNDDNVKV